MALDWTLPSFTNEAFDIQNLDFDEPVFFDSIHQSDPPSLPQDAYALYPPDPLPVELWTGLGCTCGLSFITCTEHISQYAADAPDLSSSDVVDYGHSSHTIDHQKYSRTGSPHRDFDATHDEENAISPRPASADQVPLAPPKLRRAMITKGGRYILEQQLAINPYPTAQDVKTLSSRTNPSPKTIMTWFSNNRSRKLKTQLSKQTEVVASRGPKATRPSTRDLSPMIMVSSGSLMTLNRLSPASSTSSLEKFLSTPMTEEGASATAIQAALRDPSINRPVLSPYGGVPPDAPRPYSNAESGSSMSSIHSFQSCASQLSVDSRGSHRGRKMLMRRRRQTPQSARSGFYSSGNLPRVSRRSSQISSHRGGIHHVDESSPISVEELLRPPALRSAVLENDDTDSHAETTSNDDVKETSVAHRFFCTWPSYDSASGIALTGVVTRRLCTMFHTAGYAVWRIRSRIFRQTDHAAVKHCGTCQEKDMNSRTFYREDQLAQHIKRVHLREDTSISRVSKDLLFSWKTANPDFLDEHLHCGFCGLNFYTWTRRQDHVFAHISDGLGKSSWLPGRCVDVSFEN